MVGKPSHHTVYGIKGKPDSKNPPTAVKNIFNLGVYIVGHGLYVFLLAVKIIANTQ